MCRTGVALLVCAILTVERCDAKRGTGSDLVAVVAEMLDDVRYYVWDAWEALKELLPRDARRLLERNTSRVSEIVTYAREQLLRAYRGVGDSFNATMADLASFVKRKKTSKKKIRVK